MHNAITIKNKAGRRFLVKFLAKGDKFGLTDSRTADKDLVEFYDLTYANQGDFDENGQSTGGIYNVDTILGRDDFTNGKSERGTGLCLHGGIPEWTIDGLVMDIVRGWLANMADRKTLTRQLRG